MTRSDPPRLAVRLITRFVTGPHADSLIGDLIEQHGRGRSALWFWRETVIAITRSTAESIRRDWLLALCVVMLSVSLEPLYVRTRVWLLVYRVDQLWYPRLIGSRWSWMVVNPWAYRLQLYFVTTRVAWCGLMAAVSWAVCHVRPRQRGLIVTLLLIPQLATYLFYMRAGLMDGLRAPADSIAFFGMFWFAVFELIAVPASVMIAGLAGQRRGEAA